MARGRRFDYPPSFAVFFDALVEVARTCRLVSAALTVTRTRESRVIECNDEASRINRSRKTNGSFDRAFAASTLFSIAGTAFGRHVGITKHLVVTVNVAKSMETRGETGCPNGRFQFRRVRRDAPTKGLLMIEQRTQRFSTYRA